MEYLAHVARGELARRDIALDGIDYGVLGLTVAQRQCFFGLPWVTAMMGADRIPGPTINQACATGARCLQAASQEVETGGAEVVLAMSGDRTSNGPHIYYPAPHAPGGTGAMRTGGSAISRTPLRQVRDDRHRRDVAGMAVTTRTARRGAPALRAVRGRRADAGRPEALHAQPLDVPDARYRKTSGVLDGDEGIHQTPARGLDRLRPSSTTAR